MQIRFVGKTVVVSGAGHGFGRCIAETFAGLGARVFGTDISATELAETARAGVATQVLDLTDRAAAAAWIGRIEADTGGAIDVLVNNAGGVAGQEPVPLEDVADADWDRIFAINVGAAFALSRAAAKFETGPLLFNPNMRHAAMLKRGNMLHVFWTQVGDAPESILMSRIDLSGDWMGWRDESPVVLLRPELDWEGANAPCVPSVRSTAYGQVNQLRDPAIYEEGDRAFLLYAVAGESGVAAAELWL